MFNRKYDKRERSNSIEEVKTFLKIIRLGYGNKGGAVLVAQSLTGTELQEKPEKPEILETQEDTLELWENWTIREKFRILRKIGSIATAALTDLGPWKFCSYSL